MAASPEFSRIHYAGSSPLRAEFLKHVTGDRAEIIPIGAGIELEALHPLSVAQEKIAHAQHTLGGEPVGCCIAFDTLTYVPTVIEGRLLYEARRKPSDEAAVQRLFWEMSRHLNFPYRIRSASILLCNGEERSACHDASIALSPRGLALLSTDTGFSAYVSHVRDFGYPFGQDQSPITMAAGLNFETLLALGYVEAVDGVYRNHYGFERNMQRAFFLATVGASHKVLGPLTHNPMGHIITFPFYCDGLTLLKKYSGPM